MSERKTVVPSIPAIGRTANEIDAALKAVKESVEVGYGRRGDPLDRFVTVRDLKDVNLVGTAVSGGMVTLTLPPGDGSGPPGAPIFDPGDPDFGNNDYTPPPPPKNVTVAAIAPSGLIVTWDPPDYRNHAYAEVFRLPEVGRTAQGAPIPPTFNLAASGFTTTKPVGPGNIHPNYAGRADGTIFTDDDLTRTTPAGQNALDAALKPTTYYYWVRFVSTAKVVGPYAPLANQGAAGQLSIDPALVLGQLITNVQNSATYRQLVGQYFNTASFDPIMQAGGVTNYIATLDAGVTNRVATWVNRIVGASGAPAVLDGYTGQSVFAHLNYIEGEAYPDHVRLNNIQSWQAALALAAGNPPGQRTAGFRGVTVESGATWVWTNNVTNLPQILAVGDTVTISTSDPRYASINGRQFVVASISLEHFSLGVVVPGLPDGFGPEVIGSVTWGSAPADVVNFVASVYRNVFVSADPTSVIAREISAVRTSIGEVSSEVQQVSSSVQDIKGNMLSSWTVRMRQESGGLVSAAGFGLGLDTKQNPDGSFSTLSTFLINANQFAVMGTGATGAIIESISGNGATATVTLRSSGHGIKVGEGNAVFAVSDGDLKDHAPNPMLAMGLAGISVDVTAVSGSTVTVKRTDNGSFSSASNLRDYRNALMPAPNIPFVIDTERGVVGIRGKLVVDGLVRATTAEFSTLTATTAFIKKLQAEVVNANVVIGQRIIAGTPGSGAMDAGSYNAISNFIVELNNPVTNQYPLRYWKPSTGQMVFGLDQQANLFVGGNMSVGRNATIATTGQSVLSIGGAGAENDGSQYPLWIGPRSSYGNNGAGRTEDQALFFVREMANGTARAGFNSDLFLGDSGLMLPALTGNATSGASWGAGPGSANPRASSLVKSAVSSGRVTIRPTRTGGSPKVLIIVSGNLATVSGGTDRKGFLLKATLTGSNANHDYDSGDGTLIQEHVFDDFPMEAWPYTLMGVVQVPPGSYYVRVNVKDVDNGPMSIISGWTVLAQNVV